MTALQYVLDEGWFARLCSSQQRRLPRLQQGDSVQCSLLGSCWGGPLWWWERSLHVKVDMCSMYVPVALHDWCYKWSGRPDLIHPFSKHQQHCTCLCWSGCGTSGVESHFDIVLRAVALLMFCVQHPMHLELMYCRIACNAGLLCLLSWPSLCLFSCKPQVLIAWLLIAYS